MKAKAGRMRRATLWLGVACLGLLAAGAVVMRTGRRVPVAAVEPQPPDVQTPAAAAGPRPTALRISRNRMAHDGRVWSVAFSPDGKTLASAGDTGPLAATIRFWDVTTGTERATARAREWGFWCLAFSPDGKVLASGD
jgi:hypothetical protein